MNIIVGIILIAAALIVGGFCGFMIFRFVLKGKYNEMIDAAKKEDKHTIMRFVTCWATTEEDVEGLIALL